VKYQTYYYTRGNIGIICARRVNNSNCLTTRCHYPVPTEITSAKILTKNSGIPENHDVPPTPKPPQAKRLP